MFALPLLAIGISALALATPTRRAPALEISLSGRSYAIEPAVRRPDPIYCAAPTSVHSIGEITVVASVTNTGSEDVKVLKYGTVLDGDLPTRSFVVSKDGAEADFVGVRVRILRSQGFEKDEIAHVFLGPTRHEHNRRVGVHHHSRRRDRHCRARWWACFLLQKDAHNPDLFSSDTQLRRYSTSRRSVRARTRSSRSRPSRSLARTQSRTASRSPRRRLRSTSSQTSRAASTRTSARQLAARRRATPALSLRATPRPSRSHQLRHPTSRPTAHRTRCTRHTSARRRRRPFAPSSPYVFSSENHFQEAKFLCRTSQTRTRLAAPSTAAIHTAYVEFYTTATNFS